MTTDATLCQGSASFATGCNGLPVLRLAHGSGATAEIYLLGAHVTSWKTADGRERLFLSAKSEFADGVAIRGGVPVIFPQFGDGPLPKHGFARTKPWALRRVAVLADGTVEARLGLTDDAATRALWPFAFDLELAVRLGDSTLELVPALRNVGDTALPYQFALHTYFAVDNIQEALVRGLQGVDYLDSLRNQIRETETREHIPFAAETDRIYVTVPDTLAIDGTVDGQTLGIQKQCMADAVVWNPWIAKAKAMRDFGDDEFTRMLCVETGAIIATAALPPGAVWQGLTRYSV